MAASLCAAQGRNVRSAIDRELEGDIGVRAPGGGAPARVRATPVLGFPRVASLFLILGLFLLVVPSSGESGREAFSGHFTHLDSGAGLPNSVARQVLQDRQGFLWVGTQNGLARFDGFRFETYAHDPNDPDTLSGSYVVSLLEDSRGDLWIGTLSDGLNRFDPSTGTFARYRHDPANSSGLSDDSVLEIYEDRAGDLWIGTGVGLDRYDPATGTFEHHRYESQDLSRHLYNHIEALWEDHLGILWVATQGGLARLDRARGRIVAHAVTLDLGPVLSLLEDRRGEIWLGAESGLYRLDRSRREIVAVPADFADSSNWSRDEVTALYEDRRGVLWIGTGRGVIRLDPRSGLAVVSRHQPGRPNSLGGDYIWDIAEDRFGGLWFATRAGISRTDPRHQFFTHYRPGKDGPRLGNVASVHEDRHGDLWVGTWGQGLHRFDRSARLERHYRHDPSDPTSLSNDWVWTIYEDSRGELWFGTNAGLDRLDRESGAFLRFVPKPGGPTSLGPGGIGGIVEDPAGELWVAKSSLLNRLDPRTGNVVQYAPDPVDPAGLSGHELLCLYIDRQGELWICSDGGGLVRFDRGRESFRGWLHDPEDPTSLSHNQVSSIYEDEAGRFFVGTLGGGLSQLEEQRGIFRHIRKRDGLPSDWITGIQGGDQGSLWLGTDQGLARFDPATGEVRVYDADDGALRSFSARAHGRSRSGALFFGGSEDLIAFFPDRIAKVEKAPPVFITGLETLGSGSPDKVRRTDLLPRPVRRGGAAVVLSPESYLVSFEFAALEFANPEKVKFVYRLEGFDRGWIPAAAATPVAPYSRIPAGTYTLHVRAANRDGVWDEPGASLRVIVLPPFWRTWWAYSLYALLALGVVLAFVVSQRRKVAYERTVSARLRHVDKLKDEFLANTSHELRTPLYGMIGLAESLIDGVRGKLPAAARSDLSMLISSGRRLGGLVDDILDFSRLRHGGLELRRRPVDLRSLVEVVLALSAPLLRSKELELLNSIPADLPAADADENRLQQILYNLVGNAIKFSDSGTIAVTGAVEGGRLVVSVADDGIGVPAELETRIFEAFAQGDASSQREYGGTGLGLAVTRQLVELHGGSLWLDPSSDHGSTFRFTLPIAAEEGAVFPEAARPGVAAPSGPETPERKAEVIEPESAAPPLVDGGCDRLVTCASARILVVDDEPVNRRVLLNHLTARHFRVEQASSGAQALRRLAERSFDLVLLDVMMPKMSGYEVCRRLRERFSLHQLPVIFLTAKNRTSDLVAGLELGANDYLTKPVPKDELLARVHNHLDLLFIHRNLESLIEERGRLLEERGRLIEDLQTRNAELAGLNYTIAHDLRNPLTTIKNYLGLARRGASRGHLEQIERNLERVDGAADRLCRQLDDLFELSRLGHDLPSPQRVSLVEVARGAYDRLAVRFAERGVVFEIAPELPSLDGDRDHLQEMFRQLFENALKFLGDQASPKVEVGVREAGDEEIIYVRDNGLGIESRYHEKVFGIFDRLNPEIEGPEIEGTGVGLAIVKRIVGLHRGRIWVESQGHASGSTFCFTLSGERRTEAVDVSWQSVRGGEDGVSGI